MARRKFTSEKSAEGFAKAVGGQVNDLRRIENAKSDFSVTYKRTEKTKEHNDTEESQDWCPEEDRDFGYPNSFWQD